MGWCIIFMTDAEWAVLSPKARADFSSMNANALAQTKPANSSFPRGAEEYAGEGADRGMDPWGYNKR